MKLMEDDIGPKWKVFTKKIFRSKFAKKISFLKAPPPQFFFVFSDNLFFRISSWSTSNFIDRFQISSKNMHPFRSYDILNLCSVFWDIFQKLKTLSLLNGSIYLDEIWNLSMKFDVDYDEILKNRLSLKTKKNWGGGAFKNEIFFANLDRKIFFVKTFHLGPISSSISFIWVPCSELEI